MLDQKCLKSLEIFITYMYFAYSNARKFQGISIIFTAVAKQ